MYEIIQDKKFEEEITGLSNMDMGGGGPEMMGYDAHGHAYRERKELPANYLLRSSELATCDSC